MTSGYEDLSANSPGSCTFLNDLPGDVFFGANGAAAGHRVDRDALHFQPRCRPVEKFRQVFVFAIHTAKVNRQRRNRPLVMPHGINDGFPTGSLRPDILRRHAVDPDFARPFNICAVVTYKLQHKELEEWKRRGVGLPRSLSWQRLLFSSAAPLHTVQAAVATAAAFGGGLVEFG